MDMSWITTGVSIHLSSRDHLDLLRTLSRASETDDRPPFLLWLFLVPPKLQIVRIEDELLKPFLPPLSASASFLNGVL